MSDNLHLHRDVFIGDLALNSRDDDGGTWILQDVVGWWETPPAEIPEDVKPYNQDGNYYTAGRYGPRNIQIEGVYLPPTGRTERDSQLAVSRAYERLNSEINLVRRTGVLTFHEVEAVKQIEVQLAGLPLITTDNISNHLRFDIDFVASDPRKVSAVKFSHTATMLQIHGGGRTYPKTFPKVYSPVNGSNRIYINNAGDAVAYPTIRITGPISKPRIDHSETEQFFLMDLDLGNNDYLDVDMQKRTVFMNGSQSRMADLDFGSTWFGLLPGTNTLIFRGTQATPPQEGWAAATNIVANPSMESTTGTEQVIHRNVMPDPSFKGSTTSVVSRTNVASNPTFEPDSVEEFENLINNPRSMNTSGTVVVRENLANNTLTSRLDRVQGVFGSPSIGEGSVRVESQGAAAALTPRIQTVNPDHSVSVEPTATYSITVQVRGQADAGYPVIARSWEQSAAGYVRNGVLGSAPSDGEWHTISATTTMSETTTLLGWQIAFETPTSHTMPDGTWFEARRLSIEKSVVPVNYFDGDYSPDPDLTPAWSGTPGASTSKLLGESLVGGGPTSSQSILYQHEENGVTSHRFRLITGGAIGINFTDFEDVSGNPEVSLRFRARSSRTITVTPRIYNKVVSPIVLPANEWVVVEVVQSTNDTTPNFGTGLVLATNTLSGHRVGDVIDITERILTVGERDIPYFDGSFEDSDPIEYSWTGDPDNSPSIMRVRAIDSVAAAPDTEVLSSSEWSENGDYSIKITPTSEDNNNTFADITAISGIAPGRTFTIAATCAVPNTLDGPLHEHARGLVLSYSSGGVDTVNASQADSNGGRVSFIATVPPDALNVRLRAYNGSSVNSTWSDDDVEISNIDSVYWDSLTVIPGGAQSTFFSGDSTAVGAEYSWNGVVSEERRPMSTRWILPEGASGYVDQVDTSDLVVDFLRSVEISTTPATTFTLVPDVVTVGAEITASEDILVSPSLFTDLSTFVAEEIRVPANTPTLVRTSIENPHEAFRVGFTLSSVAGNPVELVTARINSVMLVPGRYIGPYFDGDSGLSGFLTKWDGAQSVASGFRVPGYSASDEAVAYRAKTWSSVGSNSLALERKDDTDQITTTYAELTGPAWSGLPNGQYTLFATVFADPGEYLPGPEARTIEIADNGAGRIFRSEQASQGESTSLVLKFTKETNNGYIRLVSNALNNETVYWDGILIVAGDYSDRYFDGTSPEATWQGTPHASRSVQSAKVKVPAASLFVEHRNSWIR